MNISGLQGVIKPAVQAKDPMAELKAKLKEPIRVPGRDVQQIRARLAEKAEIMQKISDFEEAYHGTAREEFLQSQQRPDAFSGDYTDNMAVLNIGHWGDDMSLERAAEVSVPIHIWDTKIPTNQERLEDLRQNGLGKEVDWFRMEFQFSTLSNVQLIDNAQKPESAISYFASQYATVKDRITKEFTGEEQAAQLEKLEGIYNKYTEQYAKNLSESLGGLFEDAGVAGEREKVALSVKNALAGKVETYTKIIQDNPDFARPENQEDAWVLRCDEYVASKLRGEAAKTAEANPTPAGSASEAQEDSYSIAQLEGIYQYAMVGTHLSRVNFSGMEEGKNDGAKAGAMMLSAKVLGAHLGVSQAHQDALESILTQKLSTAPKNKAQAQRTTQAVMDSYNANKDLTQALNTLFTQNPGTSKKAVNNYLQQLFARFGAEGLLGA